MLLHLIIYLYVIIYYISVMKTPVFHLQECNSLDYWHIKIIIMLGSPLSPQDAAAQLTTFKSYVALIADTTPGSKICFFCVYFHACTHVCFYITVLHMLIFNTVTWYWDNDYLYYYKLPTEPNSDFLVSLGNELRLNSDCINSKNICIKVSI